MKRFTLPHRQHRDYIEIIVDILTVCREESIQTRVLMHATLSSHQWLEYSKVLLENGLLMCNSQNFKYTTTQKGLKFLKNVQKLRTLIE